MLRAVCGKPGESTEEAEGGLQRIPKMAAGNREEQCQKWASVGVSMARGVWDGTSIVSGHSDFYN